MKVKFNRSILVSGIHHEAGSVADIPHPLSAVLISYGDCSPAPASPEREAAVLPPVAETAALKPATATKKPAKK
jgi:hypothetical protein